MPRPRREASTFSTEGGVVDAMGGTHSSPLSSDRDTSRPDLSKGREKLRILLSSTSFVASLFWLIVTVSAMLFVFPYSENLNSVPFYIFLGISIVVFLGYRFFPYHGYHPVAYSLLLIATDALIALMIFLAGGGDSALAWLYPCVLLFSSTYLELWGTLMVTLATILAFISPVIYQDISSSSVKGMFVAIPSFFLISLCGHFLIRKAREEEREKLELTMLYSQADTHRKELSVLYTVSVKLAATLSEDDILGIVAEKVHELVEHDAMVLCLYRDGRLIPKTSAGIDGALAEELTLAIPGNPLIMAAEAMLPVLAHAGEEGFPERASRAGYLSLISTPIFASGRTLGALCLLSTREDAFDDDSARLLLTLCSEAAAALEKARLYRKTLEEKGKAEAIIRGLNDGLLVLDITGKVALANPSAERIMGRSGGLTGLKVEELLRGDEGDLKCTPHPWEAFHRVLETGEMLSGKLEISGQRPLHYQMTWIPLVEETGRSFGVAVILHDVTDFVELDRVKDDFISIVSHELRTPLTSVKGFLRLLQAERVGPLNEKQRKYLDTVLQQTDGLISLVGDLLDLSRMEAGKIRVERKPEDMGEIVREVVGNMESLFEEKELDVRLDLPSGPTYVMGDRERIRQVLVNLLHNSVKFTPRGGRITIRVERVDGGAILLQVSDNGQGIPPRDLEKIFDKFYQVDPSSTRQQPGAGLGLPICRKLVEAMDGKIWAESDGQSGSTFKVLLPGVTEMESLEEGGSEGSSTLPFREDVVGWP